MQSSMPDWVPENARTRINELLDQPTLSKTNRALLNRLATYPIMKSEVWDKLPPDLKGHEAQIIDWAFQGVVILPWLIRRPIPLSGSATQRKKYGKYLEQFPPLTTPIYAVDAASLLAGAMADLEFDTKSGWARLWAGDQAITFEKALGIVGQLQLLYRRMEAEHQALLSSLPKVRRWDKKTARRLFSEFFSQRMRDFVGLPHDAIVSALEEVAFDLKDGTGAETVRGRRRAGSIPVKSKRKSR